MKTNKGDVGDISILVSNNIPSSVVRALGIFEISFALHPERFYEGTNEALKCSNCTDVLCGKRNCAADIPDFENITKGI